MTPSPQQTLISKWSLKPREQNTTRVRDNQRRHRARVKFRIESLETELRQSRQELRLALARIEELEALVAAGNPNTHAMSNHFNDSALGPSRPSDEAAIEQSLPSEGPGIFVGDSTKQGCCRRLSTPVSPLSGQQHCDQNLALSSDNGISTKDPLLPSSISADQTTANPIIVSLIAKYDHDSLLPLVAPGESTTLCRVAYEIILQQNMAGIDMFDVEQWLWPGFRRETKQGEGCRVDTKVLYALIDHMSPL
ncbi:hypothetical protein FLONG3_3086 [Fusarium longipes]|uniref:Uncharacterized protein n=1 Tax=Fusarium longipes TaxID=694270 RepID=A0A395T2Z3_9HYPO|nr:hypothetical protein FLONG3_3086 [Fusarium longipes]